MGDIWWGYEISFLRCMGFLCLLPFPAGISGVSIRTGISLSFSVVFAPLLHGVTSCSFLGMILEYSAGMIFSLPLVLCLYAISAIGELMDAVRGQTIGSMYDASASAPLSVSSGILHHYGWVVILLQGGFEQSLRTLWQSFEIIPEGSVLFGSLGAGGMPLLSAIVSSLRASMSWIAPFAMCCFFVESCFGLASRLSPGVSFQSECFQIKSLLALVALYSLSRIEFPASPLELFSLLQSTSTSTGTSTFWAK